MKTFKYVIKDELGIHARPAGLLAKEAKQYESKITIAKGDKTASASQLMKLMSLGVKQGDEIISGCVNGSGTLKVKVTKEFDDSTVAKIFICFVY